MQPPEQKPFKQSDVTEYLLCMNENAYTLTWREILIDNFFFMGSFREKYPTLFFLPSNIDDRYTSPQSLLPVALATNQSTWPTATPVDSSSFASYSTR